MHDNNQFSLFKQRRFLPLFTTQFLGAFNDNLFKSTMLVMITFFDLGFAGLDAPTLVNAAAGIFILPFFLFSATAGQLAEKFDKATLARWIKLLEIAIMLLASIGFIYRSVALLMGCLFLMGVHSTLFGPLKYSILPQYLSEQELLGGNGLIEMGTFVAILLGQIGGTLLVERNPDNVAVVAAACIGVAILGYLSSRAMPPAPPQANDLKINWNIFTETWHIIRLSRRNLTVFHSLMGISWFWFFGAVYLTQLPTYAKEVLGGNAEVYTLLVALFSVGVGAGSALCEVLSGRKIEVGLVPFGSIGMCIFGIDLYFAAPLSPAAGIGAMAFLHNVAHWRLMADFTLLGIFGGFFIVPLYALIQLRSEPEYRSRIIAANNILNSCFMVVSAVVSILILHAGASIPHLLLIVALMNIPVAFYVYGLQPEFLMRFLVWIATHTMYRVKHEGLQNIPEEGAAVLICNHVSFMDALVIGGAIRRPVRFVMDHRIFKIPLLSFIFRTAGAIPIAPAKEDPAMKERAFIKVQECLSNGELVCIFPEGKITYDGEMGPFKPGVIEIAQRSNAPVIPMALRGLWGSFFSRKDGTAMLKMPRRIWSRITLVASTPVPVTELDLADLQTRVGTLRGNEK
ncbi:MFS transporter [Chitinimonas sp. BJB300]|uniref:MFS transporter n=1 Tax=Chitinimonas sp. BJB300 TaxID=1559339 RepID=UPI000C0C7C4E|nr:MFS transporter [Chitinimonas sp. BJB300]PHV11194.1 glycerol acyltransferase [Chitinimonas sp. BJB300]TSJ89031.1 MFS transporter [Chitinimonas sp. BJB300]